MADPRLRGSLLADLRPLRESRDFRAVFASRTVAWLGTEAAEVALLVQASPTPLPRRSPTPIRRRKRSG